MFSSPWIVTSIVEHYQPTPPRYLYTASPPAKASKQRQSWARWRNSVGILFSSFTFCLVTYSAASSAVEKVVAVIRSNYYFMVQHRPTVSGQEIIDRRNFIRKESSIKRDMIRPEPFSWAENTHSGSSTEYRMTVHESGPLSPVDHFYETKSARSPRRCHPNRHSQTLRLDHKTTT